MNVRTLSIRGWEIVRVTAPPLEMDVLPGKGGDILALRLEDLNLLWTSPWGLRERTERSAGTDSAARFLETYPGGWQTLFPNGGEACVERGGEWGFHGEACMIPWAFETDHDALVLRAQLSTVPFSMERRLELDANELRIIETAHHHGTADIDVMWSHHPAFGAPLLSGASGIECDAAVFVADAERDVAASDLEPGAVSSWPHARARNGQTADLRILPGPNEHLDRFGYLTGFREGVAAITNPEMGLRAEIRWDTTVFPHAWYWLEAHATQGPPWHGRAYVFAIEPASSFPGHGIASVRKAGGTLVRFAPGESKTATISFRVERI